MKIIRSIVLLASAMACAHLSAVSAAPVAATAPATPATPLWEIRNVKIPSAAMKRDMPATVVLPGSYAKEPTRRYPVVYLLHGAGDDCNGWVISKQGNAAYLAEKYQVILMLPTAALSWYFDTPSDGNYGTHVGQEVPAWADANLRTIAKREARAIAGLSMGGHGAIWLAMHNPNTFGAIGAMSGGYDLRPWAAKNQWGLGQKLGADPKAWEEHSVLIQAPKLIKPGQFFIMLDCGSEEELFQQANRDLHRVLLEKKIPHIYTERPGGHAWPVWRDALMNQMEFFARHFETGTLK